MDWMNCVCVGMCHIFARLKTAAFLRSSVTRVTHQIHCAPDVWRPSLRAPCMQGCIGSIRAGQWSLLAWSTGPRVLHFFAQGNSVCVGLTHPHHGLRSVLTSTSDSLSSMLSKHVGLGLGPVTGSRVHSFTQSARNRRCTAAACAYTGARPAFAHGGVVVAKPVSFVAKPGSSTALHSGRHCVPCAELLFAARLFPSASETLTALNNMSACWTLRMARRAIKTDKGFLQCKHTAVGVGSHLLTIRC